jgi:hypothetical protein
VGFFGLVNVGFLLPFVDKFRGVNLPLYKTEENLRPRVNNLISPEENINFDAVYSGID